MTSVLDSAGKIGRIHCRVPARWSIPVAAPGHQRILTDKFTVEPEGIRFGFGRGEEHRAGASSAPWWPSGRCRRPLPVRWRTSSSAWRRGTSTSGRWKISSNAGPWTASACCRSQLLAMYEPATEAVADSRRRNVEGQLGMFAMLEEEGPSLGIPVPKMNEISRADRMAMEKETTGLYLSGHPMDDYRPYLKNTHVLPIGSLMDRGADGGGRVHRLRGRDHPEGPAAKPPGTTP